ncbi:MAG TPA: site-specific integrase [Streptosporangiaceae bacterium]|nr:site-specific integrase [Streptosporangiaceae bacterium]
MSETKVSRRSRGEDAIYFAAAKNRYVGSVSLGYGPDGKRIRRKVLGKTKQEVRDRLKALHQEMNSGVRSSSTYTVRQTVEDWLRDGLDGTSERTRTLYEGLLEPVVEMIGARPLRDLSAGDVRSALGKLVTRYSTRSLQITRNSLERAIRHAEADDLVGRNVAALVKSPRGRTGRPSKSFTLEQAKVLLAAAEPTRWHAYVALSLLVGVRTEEVRALRWDHVVTWVDDATEWQPVTTAGLDAARSGDDRYAIYVWRSDRYGGDTKTDKSRRTLALPHRCVEALRQHMQQQERDRLRAGELWQDNGLVFASRIGTPLTANNVIRAFRIITKKAGLGEDWVPREMRHTFVSVLSANGVPVEDIALLAGHDRTTTTESVYRHEIRPVLTQGAEVMDKIFG